MAGSGYEFAVRPEVLDGYAEALWGAATDLAVVGEALGRVRVERGWFGKLPQSEFLADRYARHRESELAAVAEVGAWAAAAAEELRGSAGRYSGADRVVADAVGGVVRAEASAGVGAGASAVVNAEVGAGANAEVGAGVGAVVNDEVDAARGAVEAERAEIAEPGGALG